EFVTITKRINGGTNGMADRQALYARALEVLA
ncbi:prophage PSPPH04, putative lysozyme, partial [Pseudomonas syringae pv. aceris str. M302273]